MLSEHTWNQLMTTWHWKMVIYCSSKYFRWCYFPKVDWKIKLSVYILLLQMAYLFLSILYVMLAPVHVRHALSHALKVQTLYIRIFCWKKTVEILFEIHAFCHDMKIYLLSVGVKGDDWKSCSPISIEIREDFEPVKVHFVSYFTAVIRKYGMILYSSTLRELQSSVVFIVRFWFSKIR